MSDETNDQSSGNSVKSDKTSNSAGGFDASKWVDKPTFNDLNKKFKTLQDGFDAQGQRLSEIAAENERLKKDLDLAGSREKVIQTQYKFREKLLQEGAHDPDVLTKVVDWGKVQEDKMADSVAQLKSQYGWAFRSGQAQNNVTPNTPPPANTNDPYGFANMTYHQRIAAASRYVGDEKIKYLQASKEWNRTRGN